MSDDAKGKTVFGYYGSLANQGHVGVRGVAGRSILGIRNEDDGLYFDMSDAPLEVGPIVQDFVGDQLRVYGVNHAQKLLVEDSTTAAVFTVDTITPQVNVYSDLIIAGTTTLESTANTSSLLPSISLTYDVGSMSKKYNKLFTANISDTGNACVINNAWITGSLIGDISGTAFNTLNVSTKSAAQVVQSVDDTLAATDAFTNSTLVKRDSEGSFSAHIVTSENITPSSGLLIGGELSINATTTKFDISAGSGLVTANYVDGVGHATTHVSWTAFTLQTPTYLLTDLISFISIDVNGAIVQSTTKPTDSETRDIIYLGVLVHVDKTVLDAVNNQPLALQHPANQIHDIFDALGQLNLSGNAIYEANGDLTIQKTQGTLLSAGSNYHTDPNNPHVITIASANPQLFQIRTSDGVNQTGLTETDIDPDMYEPSPGTYTTVNNNKFTIQRFYLFTSGNVKVQPGQAQYGSLQLAIDSIFTESFTTEPSILSNGVFIAVLIVKKGCTDLSDSSKAVFEEIGKFSNISGGTGTSTATLQSAYDNSVSNPEILTNSIGGKVSIRQGTGADADVQLSIQNAAGSDVMTVSGDGILTVNSAIMPVTGADLGGPSNVWGQMFSTNLFSSHIYDTAVSCTVTGALIGNASTSTLAADTSNVGNKTQAQVETSVDATLAATNLAVNSTIVKRDSNGDFSAGYITATVLGDCSGSSWNTANVGTKSDTEVVSSVTETEAATHLATADTICKRANTGAFLTESFEDLGISTPGLLFKADTSLLTAGVNLHTQTNSTNSITLKSELTTTQAYFGTFTSDNLDIITNNTSRIKLKSTGNIYLESDDIRFNGSSGGVGSTGMRIVDDVLSLRGATAPTIIFRANETAESGKVWVALDNAMYFFCNANITWTMRLSDSDVFYNYSIRPNLATNTVECGTSGFRWNKLHSKNITDDGTDVTIETDLRLHAEEKLFLGDDDQASIYRSSLGNTIIENNTRYMIMQTTAATRGIYVRLSDTSYSTVFSVEDGSNAPMLRCHADGDTETRNLVPNTNNTYTLGSSSLKWDAIWARTSTISTSDRQDKNDIRDSPLGLDFILSLKPRSYIFKGRNRRHYGLVADEVHTALAGRDFAGYVDSSYENNGNNGDNGNGNNVNERTNNDPNDPPPVVRPTPSDIKLGLRYEEFVAPLVKAVQEQQKMIDDQRLLIDELFSRLG